eukprot:5146151-Amphidinium_carterae.1
MHLCGFPELEDLDDEHLNSVIAAQPEVAEVSEPVQEQPKRKKRGGLGPRVANLEAMLQNIADKVGIDAPELLSAGGIVGQNVLLQPGFVTGSATAINSRQLSQTPPAETRELIGA